MNKIEEYRERKMASTFFQEVPRYATDGWQAINDGDKERLKWRGVFFRRQTPGHCMMRVRLPSSIMTASQLSTLAMIAGEFGKGFADITTRQQIQLRRFTIHDVPEIWRRRESVELISLQTGMDNIRGVVGCPVAGLSPKELFDACPVVKEYPNVHRQQGIYESPRKFNVTITACKEVCTHTEAQDLALTPVCRTRSFLESVRRLQRRLTRVFLLLIAIMHRALLSSPDIPSVRSDRANCCRLWIPS